MTTAQKISASTQKFIEIQDIRENVVLLTGNRACMVLQVTATNFSLLSREEQDARMFAYASLLNSLSFPIEILIKNKKVQIESYLKLLKDEAEKTTNPKLAQEIRLYREFIEDLVKLTSVLDKQFFIVIPYNSLESGLKGSPTSSTVHGVKTTITSDDAFFSEAKTSLRAKAEALVGQVERISLRAKILDKEELIKVYYEIFNPEDPELHDNPDNIIKPYLVEREKQL